MKMMMMMMMKMVMKQHCMCKVNIFLILGGWRYDLIISSKCYAEMLGNIFNVKSLTMYR